MNQLDMVHEIAIRKVKPGKADEFRKRRAAFIAVLKKQAGVLRSSGMARPCTPDGRTHSLLPGAR